MPDIRTPFVDEQLLNTLLLGRRDPLDELELAMLGRIRPVITIPMKPGIAGGTTKYFVLPDSADSSFLHSFMLGGAAGGLGGIAKLGIIYTLHEIDTTDEDFPSFSPTPHQVYRMIPQHLHWKLCGFETITPSDDDLERQTAATAVGFHVATTVLYV